MAEKIKLLPEKYQQVVIMRFFHEKEFDEIARALNTSQGNVRVILSRAVTKLKDFMGNIESDWRE